MLVIVDGADLTGKSTLASKLLYEATGMGMSTMRLHMSAPEYNTGEEEYLRPFMKTLDLIYREDFLIVCDRWCCGEMAYGPVLRNMTIMSETEHKHIHTLLYQMGALVIFLIADNSTLIERYAAEGDDLVTLPQILKLNEWYIDEARRRDILMMTSDVPPVWVLFEVEKLREAAVHGTPHPIPQWPNRIS